MTQVIIGPSQRAAVARTLIENTTMSPVALSASVNTVSQDAIRGRVSELRSRGWNITSASAFDSYRLTGFKGLNRTASRLGLALARKGRVNLNIFARQHGITVATANRYLSDLKTVGINASRKNGIATVNSVVVS